MDEIQPDLTEADEEAAKTCPLLDRPCLRNSCAWWTRDWHEAKNRYSVDCAITLIALGVNDESLFRGREHDSSIPL